MSNIKQILRYFKPHLKLTLLSPLLVAIEVCAELILPMLMADIVNKGVINDDFYLILPTGFKMILITIVGMIGGVLSIYSAGTV